MTHNNTRLLVAIDVNSRFPRDFSTYIEKSTSKTHAQVIQKSMRRVNIEGSFSLQSEAIWEDPSGMASPVGFGSDFLKHDRDASDFHRRMIDPLDISLEDIIWANSYLIVAPLCHTMLSLEVENFLDNFSEPTVRVHLRRKTVSAMTVSERSDENHIDLLKIIYTKFISHGAIAVPAGLSDRSVLSASESSYGYRQVIGEKVDEDLVDRQIQRLVDVTSAIYSNYSQNGTFSSATNL